MEGNNRVLNESQQNLQELFKKYMEAKWKECIEKKTTNRLVIQFDKGVVTSVQSQEIVTGASIMVGYINQFAEFDSKL